MRHTRSLRSSHGEALAVVFTPFIAHNLQKKKAAFDEIAEAIFHSDDLLGSFTAFLEHIHLNKKLTDFGISEEQFAEIKASPILDHLPFGTREELEAILDDAYA